MECKNNAVIHREDCEKRRVKEEVFNEDEVTDSLTTNLQQIDADFMKCVQCTDADTKFEIKQETSDPNVASRDIKSNRMQPSTRLSPGTIKDDKIDIKKHDIQDEVSPKSQYFHLEQNDTFSVAHIETSDVNTKVDIRQEVWDPNGVSSDIKCDPEQLITLELEPFLGKEPLKFGDELNLKQELPWVKGTSADSLNEGEGSGSKQNEAAEEVSFWKSPSPYTDAVYSSSATQLQENKDGNSLLEKFNTRAQKYERKHRCKTCGQAFKLLSHFKKHNLAHKVCKWGNCGKNCTHYGVLKCQVQQRQYVCATCRKSFSNRAKFKVHLLVHDDKRQYKCKICEKSFKWLGVLKTHLLVHDDKRQYKCKICEKSFKKSSNLKAHLLVHDDKRPYKCEICQKSFKRLLDLKLHLLVHNDKRQYKCTVCEKSFKQSSNLKSHLLVHDGNRSHKCEVCEKSFRRLFDLKLHLLVHDDKRQYKCKMCDKSFKRLGVLKTHLVVHDDKKPYQCKICEKSFKHSGSLKRHLLVHDNKRHFNC